MVRNGEETRKASRIKTKRELALFFLLLRTPAAAVSTEEDEEDDEIMSVALFYVGTLERHSKRERLTTGFWLWFSVRRSVLCLLFSPPPPFFSCTGRSCFRVLYIYISLWYAYTPWSVVGSLSAKVVSYVYYIMMKIYYKSLYFNIMILANWQCVHTYLCVYRFFSMYAFNAMMANLTVSDWWCCGFTRRF